MDTRLKGASDDVSLVEERDQTWRSRTLNHVKNVPARTEGELSEVYGGADGLVSIQGRIIHLRFGLALNPEAVSVDQNRWCAIVHPDAEDPGLGR